MKNIGYILLLFMSLAGCGGDTSDTLLDSNENDLSGTWLHTQAQDVYDRNSGEYLYSTYFESVILITDTDTSMLVSACRLFHLGGEPGIKTDDFILLQTFPGAPTYNRVNNNEFESELELDVEDSSNPDRIINQQLMLEKLSPAIVIDNGLLVLNNPASIVNEHDHFCVAKTYTTLSNAVSYDLHVPYGDRDLYVKMEFSDAPTSNTVYDRINTDVPHLHLFWVDSSTQLFRDTVGSSLLFPDNVVLNIHQSNNEILSGDFTFLGQNGESYSGEFSMGLSR